MQVDHRYMSTEALVKSYVLAQVNSNIRLAEEIKQILTERGEESKLPTAPISRSRLPKQDWFTDVYEDPLTHWDNQRNRTRKG